MPSRVDDTYDEIEVSGPIVLSSDDLVPKKGKMYFLEDSDFRLDVDGMEIPNFSMQEVAKCFFGHDADWLRWRIRPDKPKRPRKCPDCQGTGKIEPKDGRRGHKCKHCGGTGLFTPPQDFPNGCFVLDGETMEFKRKPSPNGSTTARYFTLPDIERMAHALAQNGIIDGLRLSVIIIQVRACAKLYGVMGD